MQNDLFRALLVGDSITHNDQEKVRELLKGAKDLKFILATPAIVYREGNKRLDGAWMKRVRARNEAVQEIAQEKGCGVDDLYAVSASISKELEK